MERTPGSRITLIIAVLWLSTLCSAYALSGPLERPAVPSPVASTSVLLAVTKAGERLVAAGERGIILLSDDDGSTWRQAKVPVSVTLTAVTFATPGKGWAVGHFGVVLHSEDGGETWVKQLDGVQAAQLVLEKAQARAQHGDAPSGETERLLADAQLLIDDGPDKPFLDLYFENEQSGFIVGAYNLIFRTDDAGRTWEPWLHRVDNPMGLHLYGIRSGDGHLFLAGEQGLFLRADKDTGAFEALPTPYPGSYFGILTAPGGEVLIFGLRGNAYWSGDLGESWQVVETGVPVSITAGNVLADGTMVLVTQSGTVLTSRDQGRTFSPLPIKEASPFADLTQAADGSIVMVGMRGITRAQNPQTALLEERP